MASNARFHNKYHRRNHHTLPSTGYPDSGADPIASPQEPFRGDFHAIGSLSATGNLTIGGNTLVYGNLSALGDLSVIDTIVTTTSALSVVNSGTGPALTVRQTGAQPIAVFFDDNDPTFQLKDGLKAQFFNSTANNTYALAEGNATQASGYASHTEGDGTIASGAASHAEGSATQATGAASHAEGSNTLAYSVYTHAEGNRTLASGNYSHAEGWGSASTGNYSHAEGYITSTGNRVSFASYTASTKTFTFTPATSTNFAYLNEVGNTNLILRGFESSVLADLFNATVVSRDPDNGSIVIDSDVIGGNSTTGWILDKGGIYAHSEGRDTQASGNYSHAEGNASIASGTYSHAEGDTTTASGSRSHVEGELTIASGRAAHAEGTSTTASGRNSHVQGRNSVASGDYSHAEGRSTRATTSYTHAEGYYTSATNTGTHSEGQLTLASGDSSHAEGYGNVAAGDASHAEGYYTFALGPYSHAEGHFSIAVGAGSHAEGSNSNLASKIISYSSYDNTKRVFTFTAANSAAANGIVFANTVLGGIDDELYVGGAWQFKVLDRSTINGNITAVADPIGASSVGGELYLPVEGAHAEGYNTQASGNFSHSQNLGTVAAGDASHAEGGYTQALAQYAHAEGYGSLARGYTSHAGGYRTATGNYSYVWSDSQLGTFLPYVSSTKTGQYMVSASNGVYIPGNVGIGTDSTSNMLTNQGGNLTVTGNTNTSRLTATTPNYSALNTSTKAPLSGSALASDNNFHLIQGRAGINTVPVSSYALHIRGGNVRIDGVDYSSVPGFNGTTYDSDGQSLFDLRSASENANYSLSIASSGVNNFMKFFGGRSGDQNPFVAVKKGQPVRFAQFNNFYGTGFSEIARIGGNSNVSIGVSADGAERLTVLGNISASGNVFFYSSTGRNLDLIHTPANDGINPVLRIGESTPESTTLSGFSGAFISYDETANLFGVSSLFEPAAAVPAVKIDRRGNIGVGADPQSSKLTVAGNLSALSAVYTIGMQPINFIPFVSKTENFNLLAAQNTNAIVYTVPAGMRAMPTGMYIVITTSSGNNGAGTMPTLGIYANTVTNANQMMGTLALATTPDHTVGRFSGTNSVGGNRNTSTTTIVVNIDVASSGTNYSALQCTVYVFGYLI